jgi:antitoxin component of RelBE/YafQ-DinJ toxin-antitoxin module
MPKKPMIQRMIRVPEDLWERAKVRADERGENVSEAVRKFLERYSR